jgi:hypothetical protein
MGYNDAMHDPLGRWRERYWQSLCARFIDIDSLGKLT